jgi:hypothetical protein
MKSKIKSVRDFDYPCDNPGCKVAVHITFSFPVPRRGFSRKASVAACNEAILRGATRAGLVRVGDRAYCRRCARKLRKQEGAPGRVLSALKEATALARDHLGRTRTPPTHGAVITYSTDWVAGQLARAIVRVEKLAPTKARAEALCAADELLGDLEAKLAGGKTT